MANKTVLEEPTQGLGQGWGGMTRLWLDSVQVAPMRMRTSPAHWSSRMCGPAALLTGECGFLPGPSRKKAEWGTWVSSLDEQTEATESGSHGWSWHITPGGRDPSLLFPWLLPSGMPKLGSCGVALQGLGINHGCGSLRTQSHECW